MKNSELISKLKQFNPDANVSTTISEDICISYISERGISKKTTKELFIEPCDNCQTGWD